MAKIELSFVKDSFDTKCMFSNAKELNIKTEIVEIISGKNEVIEVQLECDDVDHLYEFCYEHQPQCVETFWHLVEEV